MLKERRVGLEVVVIDLLVLLLINCLWKILKPTVGLAKKIYIFYKMLSNKIYIFYFCPTYFMNWN